MSQLGHQIAVNALLKTLDIRCVDEEFRAIWFEERDGFFSLVHTEAHGDTELTLINLHLGDGLPPVHGYKPCIVFSPTTQIQDQL